jgi:hypothetical protein
MPADMADSFLQRISRRLFGGIGSRRDDHAGGPGGRDLDHLDHEDPEGRRPSGVHLDSSDALRGWFRGSKAAIVRGRDPVDSSATSLWFRRPALRPQPAVDVDREQA